MALGRVRVPACNFQRSAGKPCSARRRTTHAGTRMLPDPPALPQAYQELAGGHRCEAHCQNILAKGRSIPMTPVDLVSARALCTANRVKSMSTTSSTSRVRLTAASASQRSSSIRVPISRPPSHRLPLLHRPSPGRCLRALDSRRSRDRQSLRLARRRRASAAERVADNLRITRPSASFWLSRVADITSYAPLRCPANAFSVSRILRTRP
jgi:hypothetical protein